MGWFFAYELKIEASQLEASPDAEVAELRGIYERKGVPPRMASELADHMVRSDPVLALDTMAREELGIDPKDLIVSPWRIATLEGFAYRSTCNWDRAFEPCGNAAEAQDTKSGASMDQDGRLPSG